MGKHVRPHMSELVNELVSSLAPFSAIILTVSAVVVFLFRAYVFELFMPRIYGTAYTTLSPANRRSFVNHHVAGGIKFILLVIAVYPFISVAFGHSTPHTPVVGKSGPTMGDMLIVCSQIFTVMYIFELFYREKISPISAAHHIGAILIAQSAVAMTINFDHEEDAIYEFILCFVWGAFDVLAELWPHLVMIVYRLSDNHSLLERLFFATATLELIGTISETVIVMVLFGSLWDKWALSLKIATPFLHVLFSAAQLWGAWIFRQLALREREKRLEAMNGGDDISDLKKGSEAMV